MSCIGSNRNLLSEDFDFALVFSRHSEMAGLAERLIARGTPFLIEKPLGSISRRCVGSGSFRRRAAFTSAFRSSCA